MSTVTAEWVSRGWLLLCVSTVRLQDVLPGLGLHLGDSVNVLEEVFAGEQHSSNFEALRCDCLSWGWAGTEIIRCLGYLTFIFPGKGRMGPTGFLGRTALWGRIPLPGTQQQPSLVMLRVYLPNAEINSEYFMALITPPCMWCGEWVIRLPDANFLLGWGGFFLMLFLLWIAKYCMQEGKSSWQHWTSS